VRQAAEKALSEPGVGFFKQLWLGIFLPGDQRSESSERARDKSVSDCGQPEA
jgi:hypothetical protein